MVRGSHLEASERKCFKMGWQAMCDDSRGVKQGKDDMCPLNLEARTFLVALKMEATW